jgi:hypothetical protein
MLKDGLASDVRQILARLKWVGLRRRVAFCASNYRQKWTPGLSRDSGGPRSSKFNPGTCSFQKGSASGVDAGAGLRRLPGICEDHSHAATRDVELPHLDQTVATALEQLGQAGRDQSDDCRLHSHTRAGIDLRTTKILG